MGTNAAAGLLTGDRGFLLAEDEWDRVIQENGALLGLLYLFLRVAITFHLGRNAIDQLKVGNTLALLLFAAVALLMLNGQFAQPSALGFGALGAGLCLAASTRNEESEDPSPPATPAASPRVLTVRSRSLYSETLKPGSS